jgi:hypothetical protein
VHRGNQYHAFTDAALLERGINLRRDVNVFAVLARIELKILGVKLHGADCTSLLFTVPVER